MLVKGVEQNSMIFVIVTLGEITIPALQEKTYKIAEFGQRFQNIFHI